MKNESANNFSFDEQSWALSSDNVAYMIAKDETVVLLLIREIFISLNFIFLQKFLKHSDLHTTLHGSSKNH